MHKVNDWSDEVPDWEKLELDVYIAAQVRADSVNPSMVFVVGDGKTYDGYENKQLSKIQDLFQRTGSPRNQGNHLIKRVADLRYCKTGEKHAHPIYYRFIKSKVTKIRLLSATRGARNPNVKVVITHAWHLYSQDWTVYFLFFKNVLWIKTICLIKFK